MPDRSITYRRKIEGWDCAPEFSHAAPTEERVCVDRKGPQSPTSGIPFQKQPDEATRSGEQQLQMDWRQPPLPPKPPDGHEITAGLRVRDLVSVVEERIVAPESLNSQNTPTSLAQANITPITSSTLNKMAWEPPNVQAGVRRNTPSRSKSKKAKNDP